MKQGGRPRREAEEPDSPFGEALKEHLRRVKNFTQAELAKESLVAEKTLSQMVKGKRTNGPALRRDLHAIIKALYRKTALFTLEEANRLITAIPAVSVLDHRDPEDAKIIALFNTPVAEIERVALIEDRIQGILRNNAVVDHTHLFGVDTFIEKIKDDISAPQAAWIISLCGEGGLGKTAIAYEAVTRYAASAGFTRVGWVSAKTLQLLPDGMLLRDGSAELHWSNFVKKLADQLDIHLGDNSSGWITDFQRGIRSLSPGERCLLIVDNLETVDDVDEAIQYLGSNSIVNPHKILLTTRHALLGKVRYLVERHVKGLDFEPAFHFIRSLGNDVIEEASDDELRPIVEVTEGNPLLIKLFVTRLLTSHLPLAFVLAELQAVNQRLGRNIIDYLYAESLSVLEQYCGSDAAHWILNAFCPLGAGDNVSYEALRTYSGIEDEEMFRNTLRVACDLSLIRTSKLNSLYSIHSLLWRFVCEN
jgi:transcriptional regulator with XRE-family HTH domain